LTQEKDMRTRILIQRASLLLALLMPLSAANACEFIYDEGWRVWRGDCRHTLEIKGPLVRSEAVMARTKLRIPDLQVDKLKFRLRGNLLEVSADIVNEGTGGSPLTTVVLNVTLMTASGNTTLALRPAAVPVLASMATQRVLVDTVTVDYSLDDVDVMVTGMVDPVTNAQPVRGGVFELIESNNMVTHLCRVYGPSPNVSVQPCN
jgi:hypothetical protein